MIISFSLYSIQAIGCHRFCTARLVLCIVYWLWLKIKLLYEIFHIIMVKTSDTDMEGIHRGDIM